MHCIVMYLFPVLYVMFSIELKYLVKTVQCLKKGKGSTEADIPEDRQIYMPRLCMMYYYVNNKKKKKKKKSRSERYDKKKKKTHCMIITLLSTNNIYTS